MFILSTGPIEQEGNVVQLRLKVLNNSSSVANVTATIFDLDGTKRVFTTRTFILQPESSDFAVINIPALLQFEVQFTTPDPNILVAVFAVQNDGTFSAADSVRSAEMVKIG